MSVLEGPLVFVDIETNGLSHTRGKIIEVAAIRYENNKETARFCSILDPEADIPDFISQLTGIRRQDVKGAPTFAQAADELYEVLEGAVFIAHSVRFDYSFLKQEFKRVGKTFNPKLLCTVKLSKALYPEFKSHKLQSLIERHGLKPQLRHRAFDDADVLVQFINHVRGSFDKEILESAMKQQLRSPALPKALNYQTVKNLPEGPGVYIFQDDKGTPLYIGKSINIKKRVMSHFSSDHKIETEFKMAQNIADIETRETSGELEALILESQLIKDVQPLYNRKLRRSQKLTIARKQLSSSGYITISTEDTERIDPERIEDIIAVYTSKGKARQSLSQLVKEHSLCPKLFNLEKGSGSCFQFHLKRCLGACVSQEPAEKYNQRTFLAFERQRIEAWPFSSPVIIQEKISSSGIDKAFVVDKWCIIADITVEESYSPNIKFHERVFDLDTYKILRSYLKTRAQELSIKPITLSYLRQLESVN